MHNSSVDRPDPVAPTIAATSPRSSSRSTSLRTEFVARQEPAPAVKPLWRPITSSASATPIDSAPRTRTRHRVLMHAIEIARAQVVILSVHRASPPSRTMGSEICGLFAMMRSPRERSRRHAPRAVFLIERPRDAAASWDHEVVPLIHLGSLSAKRWARTESSAQSHHIR